MSLIDYYWSSASAPTFEMHNGPRIPEGWSSTIGIVTAIIGNVLISFALNTQRYAHLRLEKEQSERDREIESQATRSDHVTKVPSIRHGDGASEPRETDALIPKVNTQQELPNDDDVEVDETDGEKADGALERKNYLRSPYWWIGIILMIVGEGGNFLAYGFAPASIVSPLGVVALISNCIFAPIMLKERFRFRDFVGVIIAIGGAVTVVLSAQDSNPKLGPDKIWKLVSRWQFLTYLGITIALISILMIASNRYGHRTVAIDIGLVGLFGGYTALSTKGVASLLSYRFWYVVTYPITYLLVAVLVGTAVMQIKYINRALQRFKSTEVIPTQFVVFTIFVVLGSAILYGDFEKEDKAKAIQFFGGVALTFVGVWAITRGRTDDDDGDDSVTETNAENGIDLVDEETTPSKQASFPVRPPVTPLKQQSGDARLRTPDFRYTLDDSTSPASFNTAPSPSRGILREGRLSAPIVPSASKMPRYTSETGTETPTTSLQFSAPSSAPHSQPRVLTRQSIAAGMRPGPFISPLSASLSAVVADNQRRRERRESRLHRADSKGKRGSSINIQYDGAADMPEDVTPRASRANTIGEDGSSGNSNSIERTESNLSHYSNGVRGT